MSARKTKVAATQDSAVEVPLNGLQSSRLRHLMDKMAIARERASAYASAAVEAETDLWREVHSITGNVDNHTYTVKWMGLEKVTLWLLPSMTGGKAK